MPSDLLTVIFMQNKCALNDLELCIFLPSLQKKKPLGVNIYPLLKGILHLL